MKTFLTCEWRKLAMANYVIDPQLAAKYLPHKTELDLHRGVCYASLVGFMFQNTCVMGMKIPFHTNFEEVNLRLYVRCADGRGSWKRGVVFVREIVPRYALSWVANYVYGEHYITLPMQHRIQHTDKLDIGYRWKLQRWHEFGVVAQPEAQPIRPGSDEEFILEHYWGYTRVSASRTFEYEVQHPRWQVYPILSHHIDVSFGQLYGATFAFLEHEKPVSVFLAEGSEVSVLNKKLLT